MRVRMKVQLSGTRNGRPWPGRGEGVELPEGEARKLLGAGMAEPETATPPEPEVSAPPAAETSTPPAAEERDPEPPKRGRGRPRPPRDAAGNIVKE
ncbi:hypothetical protein FH609_004140 [Streptomyces sp. 3MP-14]|uniref:Uncharacterized protein n=1 Tax=Streptomyces mimosae TaxID=2586635 RepID=A0A5N6A3A9_9ACTN|nr:MULTISPECIES: hypothetical protein [Streptomyces]KAB8162925.1 hypothetical protein FH607_020005 [Streptomyces mimosae]KAB8179138.1 hypothetical protein FH609_004140 [Streptomyces sp. 3MP-14]